MKEEEIRPQKIFAEYLRLAAKDTEKYFGAAERRLVSCPACGQAGGGGFSKQGFVYEECYACQTLFVSPRPEADVFCRYYKESESAEYWATTFYKETAEARREKIWRPKALLVQQTLARLGADQHTLVDIGGGYGIFAEEYEKLSDQPVTVVEPGPALARVCRDKGLQVVQEFLESLALDQLGPGAKAFVSFELFEHLHDPAKFLRHLLGLMHSGDLFLFTTLSGVGVDIQALWEDSKSVSPPHHLNFFNPRSAGILLERTGFEVLQTTTPGKLDIDILCNNRQQIKDRFWRTFVAQAGEREKAAMQEFLAVNGWSSHMLVVSRKS